MSIDADALSRGFKGLKQAIKLEFKLERYGDVRSFFKRTSSPYADYPRPSNTTANSLPTLNRPSHETTRKNRSITCWIISRKARTTPRPISAWRSSTR